MDMNRLGQQLQVRIQLYFFLKPPPMMPMLTVLLELLMVPCLYLPLRVLLAQMMGYHKLRVNLIRGDLDISHLY